MCACNCDKGMVEDAMKAEAMGMNIDYDVNPEPVRNAPHSELDVIRERNTIMNAELRKQMEEGFKHFAGQTEDTWRRLDRMERVLGLPPISDEQVRW